MQAVVNRIHIAYTDEGKGAPLVFIHGFPLNREAWAKQIPVLKSSYRVIAPDLRGFGESETTGGTVPMSRFAADLYALLEHLGTGPVILVGHSMGGYVALAFAQAYPQLLAGLVLVGTKAGADSEEAAATRRATTEQVRMEGVSMVIDAMAPKMLSAHRGDAAMEADVRAIMASSHPQGLIGALFGMAERHDAKNWLGEIRVPTLVITGADDLLIPPDESEALVQGIPGAHLRRIEGAGHLVAFEEPDAFNAALEDWLNTTVRQLGALHAST
jgi:3-oxoadipate enol-lactonase